MPPGVRHCRVAPVMLTPMVLVTSRPQHPPRHVSPLVFGELGEP